jgi:hypothetical protein
VRLTGGPDVSRRPKTASAGRHADAILIVLPDGRVMSVGVFFPRRRCDRASDIPVTFHRSPSASPTFVDAATWPYVLRSKGWYGSEDVETAKAIVHAVS